MYRNRDRDRERKRRLPSRERKRSDDFGPPRRKHSFYYRSDVNKSASGPHHSRQAPNRNRFRETRFERDSNHYNRCDSRDRDRWSRGYNGEWWQNVAQRTSKNKLLSQRELNYRRQWRDHGGLKSPRRQHRRSRSNSPLHANSRRKRRRQRSASPSSSSASSSSHDDTIGSYDGVVGDIIDHRCPSALIVLKPIRDEILGESGLGTFGRVLDCVHLKTRERRAIKVVRAVKKYSESAKIEAEILERVNHKAVATAADAPALKSAILNGGPRTVVTSSPQNMRHCVKMYDWFEWHGHVCLVFERLGPSLYEFLKKNTYLPFKMDFIQCCARQLLQAMVFLHRKNNLVHTDLKLENILIVDDATASCPKPEHCGCRQPKDGIYNVPVSNEVRLIDFGGATYDDDRRKSTTINTRQYRSPEVILGLGWSFPSDIWSVGCILMELYLGDLLFQTHDNAEHLALMERILGPFPAVICAAASKRAPSLFTSNGGLRYPTKRTSANSKKHVRQTPSLRDLVMRRAVCSNANDTVQQKPDRQQQQGPDGESSSCPPASRTSIEQGSSDITRTATVHELFLELITGLLVVDPSMRWTAEHALTHAFFAEEVFPNH